MGYIISIKHKQHRIKCGYIELNNGGDINNASEERNNGEPSGEQIPNTDRYIELTEPENVFSKETNIILFKKYIYIHIK